MIEEPDTLADIAEALLAKCLEGDVTSLAIVAIDTMGNTEVITALSEDDDGQLMLTDLAESLGMVTEILH